MGQRLVVEAFSGKEKRLANSYYHWSGYTDSAVSVISAMLERKEEVKKACTFNGKTDMLLYAVRLFEASDPHAGLCGTKSGGSKEKFTECEYMAVKYPDQLFTAGKDRNSGLISVTEFEMNQSMSWCEGYVSIDLEEEIVNFGCISIYDEDNLQELCECNGVLDDDEMDESEIAKAVETYKNSLSKSEKLGSWIEDGISFSDWFKFAEELESMPYDFMSGDTIFSKIS